MKAYKDGIQLDIHDIENLIPEGFVEYDPEGRYDLSSKHYLLSVLIFLEQNGDIDSFEIEDGEMPEISYQNNIVY